MDLIAAELLREEQQRALALAQAHLQNLQLPENVIDATLEMAAGEENAGEIPEAVHHHLLRLVRDEPAPWLQWLRAGGLPPPGLARTGA